VSFPPDDINICAEERIQANSKSSFLNPKHIQMNEAKNSKRDDLEDKLLAIWI
jgi:hypothetical protein